LCCGAEAEATINRPKQFMQPDSNSNRMVTTEGKHRNPAAVKMNNGWLGSVQQHILLLGMVKFSLAQIGGLK